MGDYRATTPIAELDDREEMRSNSTCCYAYLDTMPNSISVRKSAVAAHLVVEAFDADRGQPVDANRLRELSELLENDPVESVEQDAQNLVYKNIVILGERLNARQSQRNEANRVDPIGSDRAISQLDQLLHFYNAEDSVKSAFKSSFAALLAAGNAAITPCPQELPVVTDKDGEPSEIHGEKQNVEVIDLMSPLIDGSKKKSKKKSSGDGASTRKSPTDVMVAFGIQAKKMYCPHCQESIFTGSLSHHMRKHREERVELFGCSTRDQWFRTVRSAVHHSKTHKCAPMRIRSVDEARTALLAARTTPCATTTAQTNQYSAPLAANVKEDEEEDMESDRGDSATAQETSSMAELSEEGVTSPMISDEEHWKERLISDGFVPEW